MGEAGWRTQNLEERAEPPEIKSEKAELRPGMERFETTGVDGKAKGF